MAMAASLRQNNFPNVQKSRHTDLLIQEIIRSLLMIGTRVSLIKTENKMGLGVFFWFLLNVELKASTSNNIVSIVKLVNMHNFSLHLLVILGSLSLELMDIPQFKLRVSRSKACGDLFGRDGQQLWADDPNQLRGDSNLRLLHHNNGLCSHNYLELNRNLNWGSLCLC